MTIRKPMGDTHKYWLWVLIIIIIIVIIYY